MKKAIVVLALAAAAVSPALADDRVGTLQQGLYECGMPGDAAGKAWIADPAKSFEIVGASSYRSAQGGGTYLRRGQRIVFTRGPMKDMQLERLGSGLLQVVNGDGTLGRLRCHRAGRRPN